MGKYKNRLGEENVNSQGLRMKIIEYNGCNNINIEFENGFILKNKTYSEFKRGSVKNLYYPSVYGIGYLGEGKYKINNNTGKASKEYEYWKSMIGRCYDEKTQGKRPTYKECTVCNEWLNFQNFAEWFNENYYEVDGEKMCLDKDILFKGNKVYSPDTCLIVPNRINTLFISNYRTRGNYKIGVSKVSNPNNPKQYQARITNGKYNINKCFYTELEAFNWYKKEKEKLIKEIADNYKDKIPKYIYDVLYSYEVEITD